MIIKSYENGEMKEYSKMDFLTKDNIELGKGTETRTVGDVIAGLPKEVHPLVKKAYEYEQNGDYENLTKVCQEILKAEPASKDIQMLLGKSYFEQDVMPMAQITFWDVTEAWPDDEEARLYLALSFYAQENYKKAVENFEILHSRPNYRPDFLNAYADSLMKLDCKEKAAEIMREEILAWEKGTFPIGGEMLDRVFRNLLEHDIKEDPGRLAEDMKMYYRYLAHIDMDDEGQRKVAAALVFFCEHLTQKWYRPYFAELLEYITACGFLKGENYVKTLDSAYASMESYLFHEDHQVNALLEGYLTAFFDRTFSGTLSQKEKDNIDAAILNYEWYVCQYYEDHKDEFMYVRKTYPHSWALVRDSMDEIMANPAVVAKKTVEALQKYTQGMSKTQLEQALTVAYKDVTRSSKAPVYISEGNNSYKRMQPKVGRNDPCPCGSGKKYKKCCGK